MADIYLVEGDTAVRIDFDLDDAYGPINLNGATVTAIIDGSTTSTTLDTPATGIGHYTPSAAMVDTAGHFASTFKVSRSTNDQFFPSDQDLTVRILPHTRARS